MNRLKLKGRIIERFGSQKIFADCLGQTEQTVSRKLRGKAPISPSDIEAWCKLLSIPENEIGSFFYSEEVVTV